MHRANFRFYAQLNDFLPPEKRQVTFTHPFEGNPSIKDTIEALGVPHTEVDLILVGGEPVDFSYQLRSGDRVSVYPAFTHLDIPGSTGLVRWPRGSQARFVLDIHLGRLAAYLRMLGFDTLYRNDYPDEELARISSAEQRILLTRDTGLLKRSIITYGYYVRETNPRRQLAEVLRRFDLAEAIQPFHRCLQCNGLLEPVSKAHILDRLRPDTRRFFNEFHQCTACGKVYWKGSHYERMARLVAEIQQGGC